MNTANPLPTPTDTNPSAAQGDLPSSNLDLDQRHQRLRWAAATGRRQHPGLDQHHRPSGRSTASMTLPSTWVNGGDCAYGSLGSQLGRWEHRHAGLNGPTGDATCPPTRPT